MCHFRQGEAGIPGRSTESTPEACQFSITRFARGDLKLIKANAVVWELHHIWAASRGR